MASKKKDSSDSDDSSGSSDDNSKRKGHKSKASDPFISVKKIVSKSSDESDSDETMMAQIRSTPSIFSKKRSSKLDRGLATPFKNQSEAGPSQPREAEGPSNSQSSNRSFNSSEKERGDSSDDSDNKTAHKHRHASEGESDASHSSKSRKRPHDNHANIRGILKSPSPKKRHDSVTFSFPEESAAADRSVPDDGDSTTDISDSEQMVPGNQSAFLQMNASRLDTDTFYQNSPDFKKRSQQLGDLRRGSGQSPSKSKGTVKKMKHRMSTEEASDETDAGVGESKKKGKAKQHSTEEPELSEQMDCNVEKPKKKQKKAKRQSEDAEVSDQTGVNESKKKQKTRKRRSTEESEVSDQANTSTEESKKKQKKMKQHSAKEPEVSDHAGASLSVSKKKQKTVKRCSTEEAEVSDQTDGSVRESQKKQKKMKGHPGKDQEESDQIVENASETKKKSKKMKQHSGKESEDSEQANTNKLLTNHKESKKKLKTKENSSEETNITAPGKSGKETTKTPNQRALQKSGNVGKMKNVEEQLESNTDDRRTAESVAGTSRTKTPKKANRTGSTGDMEDFVTPNPRVTFQMQQKPGSSSTRKKEAAEATSKPQGDSQRRHGGSIDWDNVVDVEEANGKQLFLIRIPESVSFEELEGMCAVTDGVSRFVSPSGRNMTSISTTGEGVASNVNITFRNHRQLLPNGLGFTGEVWIREEIAVVAN